MGPHGGLVVMSADGNHLAIPTAKGSRQVVLIDGVEGPTFDEAGATMTAGPIPLTVQFSPTGGHSAYVGKKSNTYTAVIDGKAAETVTTTKGLAGVNLSFSPPWQYRFNQDGSHLAYVVVNPDKTISVLLDGAKGKGYKIIDFQQMIVRGKLVAYVVQEAEGKLRLVVGDKESPDYLQIMSLTATDDGAHYAFIGQRGRSFFVVKDGTEGPEYTVVTDLEMAPDGRIAYQAGKPASARPAGFAGEPRWLVVDGQEVGYSAAQFNRLDGGAGGQAGKYVAFSNDGKRFAWVKRLPAAGSSVVMLGDKQIGEEYANVAHLQFSPDGKRLGFIGQARAGGNFPVIDGQELVAMGNVTQFDFSADGSHYAILCTAGTGALVLVDGKVDPQYRGVDGKSLVFSPNGKRYAFSATVNLQAYAPIIDGTVKKVNLGSFAARMPPQNRFTFPQILFSPDSNHVAYIGQALDGTGKTSILVDDQPFPASGAMYSYPSFSPDSKHFAYVNWTGKSWNLFVDGKQGPGFDDILELNANAVHWVDAHTVQFFGIKESKVFRVTVDI